MTTTAYDLDRELNDMADRHLRGEPVSPASPSSSSLGASSSASAGASSMSSVRPQVIDAMQDDKNLAILTHIGTIAAAVFTGGFLDVIVPAVAYVLFKDKSDFLKDHVKHQLNFQLTMLAVTVIGVIFSIVTFGLGAIIAVPVMLFFFVVDIVCSIKAAVKASHGEAYQFPFTYDFLK